MNQLEMYTIFFNTMDYPGIFVARRFTVSKGLVVADKEILGSALTLEEIRKLIPEGLVRVEKDENDPPIIIETWT